jgi:hypothetical protein
MAATSTVEKAFIAIGWIMFFLVIGFLITYGDQLITILESLK